MINLFKAISRFLRLILIKNISFLWRLLNLLQAAQEKILRYKRPKVDDISTVQDVERGSLQELHTNYLTVIEADQIRDQFRRADDGRRLLFWTNVPRALAQAWANANEANTLSTMMGPLMDEMNGKKKGQAWSSYVKGVSCLFAQFARQKSAVIVLTTPPGVGRYRNNSTYISLEEPILKWSADGSEKLQINYVHPTVRSAETSEYSRWPQDHSKLWIDRFGKQQRIEALALSKEGKAGPHFSINRLPSLHAKATYDSLKQNECPSRPGNYDPIASFKAVQQDLSKAKSGTAVISRTITGWIEFSVFRFMDATSSICRRLVDSHASINGLSETIIKPSTEQMGNIASTCQEVKANKPALNVTVKPLSGGHERADKEKLQTIDLTSLQTSFDVSKTVPQVDKSTKAQMPKAQMSKAQAPKVKVPKVQVPTVPVSKPQVLKIQVPKVQAPQPQVTKAQVSKIQVAKQPQVPKVQVPEPQVPIARDSTLTTRIKSCSTKKLAAQLGHYINLLGNHSARKKVPIDFKFCASKSSEIYTVILLYNGLSFTSKSPSKRLAKRLAAKQACEHFQIS